MSHIMDKFDVIFDTVSSVEELKKIMLDMAFRGKLVPQDLNDEPSNILIVRINDERERLIKEQNIKYEKYLADINEEEYPYALPNGWSWVKIGNVCYNHGQKTPSQKFTYIDVGSINNEIGAISEELNILSPDEAPSRARKLVKKGTVIYSTVRPYLLNIAMVDRNFDFEPIVSTAFAIMHPYSQIYGKYLYHYLKSKSFNSYVESQMVGMAYPAINDQKLFNALFPLPPYNEQVRIVQKLNQLMLLFNNCKNKIVERTESYKQLNRSFFQQLDRANNNEDFRNKFSYILNHFDLLINDNDSIALLRETILKLAVQGKLVPQEPNDEPASVLLKKIQAEKEQLIKDKKIKKEKQLPELTEDEIPYQLPQGWEWVKLGEILQLINGDRGKNYPSKDKLSTKGIPFISAINIKNGGISTNNLLCLTQDQYDKLGSGKLNKNDIVYCIRGSLGKNGIYQLEQGAIASSLVIIRQYNFRQAFLKYLFYYINAPLIFSEIRKYHNGTAQPNLSAENLKNFLLPLPPLNEQKRIVEKVDQLMTLCDELERTVEQSNQESEMHMQAVLQEAFSTPERVNNIVEFPSPNSDDTEDDWDMVARADGISPETQAEIVATLEEIRRERQ